MLRRDTEDGWLLIDQHEHALLCGRIMSRWARDDSLGPGVSDEVGFALREHDNGWKDWDASPRVNGEDGYPRNFMEMDPAEQAGIWVSSFTAHRDTHPYASALIALHFGHFNEHNLIRRPGNPLGLETRERIRGFVRETLGHEPCAEGLGGLPGTVGADLRILQTGDMISLALCHGWRDYRIDDPPASAGRPEGPLRLSSPDGFEFRLSPYPFVSDIMRVSVPARRLPRRMFESDAALRRELASAPVEDLGFIISG